MREILFRAKRICDGEWIEGFYVGLRPNLQTMKPESCHCIYGLNTISYDIDPETLCQYTGLNDKNGNRIWENDIVKIGANTLVRWSEKYAGCCLVQRGWMYEHFFGEAIDERDCEVVGNIFDNPELMEK